MAAAVAVRGRPTGRFPKPAAGSGRAIDVARGFSPGRRKRSMRVKDIILDYIKNEYIDEDEADEMTLDENTPLISSGIVDSFSMVSLKRFLEKKYSISIPDDQATPEAFNTVSSIIRLVEKFKK
jgi:acyl carrier protein